MTATEARSLVIRLIGEIAPDVDAATVDGGADLQEELDLDSMDLMNLVTAVSEETGREIPDRDAGRLRTLDDWSAYLAA